MVDPGSYEALKAGDEPSGRIRWPEGDSRATHVSTHEWQLLEKDVCDGVWELGCWSSCLRWIDWLPTSRLVGISR